MKKIILFLIFLMFPSLSFAEGRMYENKKEPHCTLWDTMRLKWPQTIMGREKIKCRRRAMLSSEAPITCRFKSWKWNDDDPTQRMCTYVKAGSRMSPPGRSKKDLSGSFGESVRTRPAPAPRSQNGYSSAATGETLPTPPWPRQIPTPN